LKVAQASPSTAVTRAPFTAAAATVNSPTSGGATTGCPAGFPTAGGARCPRPWPVTLGEPTEFGLFGISTNVHEWCADWHDHDYYRQSPEVNPSGPDEGIRRASRGGAWRHVYTMCRVTLRSKLAPSFRYNGYGLRLARNL